MRTPGKVSTDMTSSEQIKSAADGEWSDPLKTKKKMGLRRVLRSCQKFCSPNQIYKGNYIKHEGSSQRRESQLQAVCDLGQSPQSHLLDDILEGEDELLVPRTVFTSKVHHILPSNFTSE